MQVSLDGLTERANGRTDFIGTGPDVFDWELFDRADACVLGRVMYPDYEKYWRTIAADPTQPLELTGVRPTADEIRYAEFANSTPHYVLSHTVSELDWPVAKPVADLDALRGLRNTGNGVIYLVGGPSTVSAAIDNGLLDELRMTVHPVLMGRWPAAVRKGDRRTPIRLGRGYSPAGEPGPARVSAAIGSAHRRTVPRHLSWVPRRLTRRLTRGDAPRSRRPGRPCR